MSANWIALATDQPSHFWRTVETPCWPYQPWKRTTECGVELYDGAYLKHKPIYLRNLDMHDAMDWPEDPNGVPPEQPYCLACYKAATGFERPACDPEGRNA